MAALTRPEATAETIDADGWLDTGDMAYIDEDGDLYITDRAKDIIIRGGENVSNVGGLPFAPLFLLLVCRATSLIPSAA